MLGRAGGLAHRPRGKRGERRRGQSGCLCFIWNCPPQATRGRPRRGAVWPVDPRTHTHTPSHKTPSSYEISEFSRSRVPTSVISCCVCRHLLSAAGVYGRRSLAARWSWRVCLCCAPSRAAAFAGIVSSHTVLTQHCL